MNEEFEVLKKMSRYPNPRDQISPFQDAFLEIYDKYQYQGVTSQYPKLNYAYDFIKKTQQLWSYFLKGEVTEGTNVIF